MTGFAGLISPHLSPAHGPERARLVGRMRRDPSVVTGEVDFAELGALAGWVSGATTLSAAPVWNGERTVCLMLLGEEFSVAREHAVPARSGENPTAAALLAAYLRYGAAFFAQLNGSFCGLLIDRRDGSVTLFNDRYGLGRVYLHESADAFLFATEAKALLAAAPSTRRIDQRGLGEFVSLGCVLQNRTLFNGITLLPPGSAWTFRRGTLVVKRRYFDPAVLEQQEPLSIAEYQVRLHEVFARATRRHLQASSAVGMSLTGGLDSRAVIAWADARPGSLPCYTFGGPFRDCADVRIARRLAGLCHLPHTTIRIDGDFFRDFDTLAQNAIEYSDGTMDISGAVELHVNRFARDIAPIRLTGNYGSEILRSHLALRPAHLDRSCYTPEFCARLDEAAATYASETAGDRLSFIAFKQVPWHHYSRRTLESAALTPRSPFLDNELVALAFRAPAALRTSPQPMLDLIAAGNPSLASVDTDRALRIGTPSPFNRVAARWQDFTVKAEYAYDYGMPHWLARADRMLTPLHLERLFLGRHKFYHFRIWYRDQLARYVRERAIAGNPEVPGFRRGAVRQLAEEHLAGRANHTLSLHKALTLQLIDQLCIRGS